MKAENKSHNGALGALAISVLSYLMAMLFVAVTLANMHFLVFIFLALFVALLFSFIGFIKSLHINVELTSSKPKKAFMIIGNLLLLILSGASIVIMIMLVDALNDRWAFG